jgi:Asp-tRNA(Asn)/Glu-tRNA(Gln) amidotransferase A subunit family amidase
VLNRRNILQALGIAGLTTAVSVPALGEDSNSGDSKNFDPIEATIADVRSSILSGDVTAEEITQAYLDRVETYSDVLSAIINVNPNSIDRAKELDEEFEKSGLVGPLHGVPTILKDNYDTDDIPTTGGSLSLKGVVPPDDAFLVERLRDAGAVILAKANMHEFAAGGTSVSSLGGQVQNPYDLTRVPSGSSGGTGASIAANLCVLGTGSDTGGSIRGPAMMGNQFGLRATVGLMSRDGIIPRALSRDTGGPMTRTVTDTAIALDVMAGHDPQDPITARSIGRVPTSESYHRGDSYTDYLNEDGLENIRIGIFRDFFGIQTDSLSDDVPTEEEAAEEINAVTTVIDAAIDELSTLGATIVDPFSMGDFEEFQELIADASRLPGEFKRGPNNYFNTLGNNAPDTIEDVLESGEYTCDIQAGLEEAQAADVSNLDEELEAVEGARQTLRDRILEYMAEDDIDVVLYPTGGRPPPKIGDPAASRVGLTPISPCANLPAMSIPAGFTKDDHLPVALELMTRQFDEQLLIEWAYAFEQGTNHREPPADFGPLPNEPPEDPIPGFSVPIGAEGCE